MKYIGFKRTPVYVRGPGPDRMRDIITKGHKARERRRVTEDINAQLAEVPDNVWVFDDFRELPDDIFDSHGDFWPCQCECCTRTWNEEEVA